MMNDLTPGCVVLTGDGKEQAFGCQGAAWLQDSDIERSRPPQQGGTAQLEAHHGKVFVSMSLGPCLLQHLQGRSSHHHHPLEFLP
jgi:hypothetical protein